MTNNIVSLELMRYQDDSFATNLTKAIDFLKIDGTYGSKAIEESNIDKIIFDRFGIDVTFKILDIKTLDAAIEIPPLSENHPLNKLFNGGDSSMGRLISNFGEKGRRIGTVDLNKGKVGGVFSEINHELVVTKLMFTSGRFSSREIAAIIAHECGHAVFNFFFILNVTLNTFITAYIANAAQEANGDNERRIIFTKGARILGVDGLKIEPLLGQTVEQNALTMQALHIDQTNEAMRSETGHVFYDAKGSEQLADMFAVKMGLGVDLASAIEKLYRSPTSRIGKVKLIALKAAAEISIAVMAISTLGTIMPKIALLLSTKSFGFMTSPYDDPKDRIIYLKRHLVQELKDVDQLDKKFAAKLISDITAIEKSASEVSLAESITSYLQRRFLPFARRIKAEQDFQKNIEGLIYNDVFVATAKLKGLQK